MFQGIAGPALAAAVIAASGFLTEFRWNGTFLVYSVAFLLFIAIYLHLHLVSLWGLVPEARCTTRVHAS